MSADKEYADVAKKSEPKPIDVDAEVTKALMKIATADSPMRFLKKKGGHPHAFASNDEKAKKVVEKCLEAGKELVTVIDEGTPQERVELTTAGREYVVPAVVESGNKLPLEDRLRYFTDDAQRKLIPAARYEELLAAIIAEQAKADAAHEEASRRLRESEEEDKRKLRAALGAIDERREARVASLKRELAAEGEQAEPPVPKPLAEGDALRPEQRLSKLPFPMNDDEKDFRRLYARQLVSAWYQAVKQGNTDGQRFLEAALYNIDGIRPIGKPGETVAFDPKLHESQRPCSLGEAAQIVFNGWRLAESRGEYTISKAQVE